MSPFRREILCAGLLMGFACLAGCRAGAARPAPAQTVPAVANSPVVTPDPRTPQVARSPAAPQPDQASPSEVRQASGNDAVTAPASTVGGSGQIRQGVSTGARLSSAQPSRLLTVDNRPHPVLVSTRLPMADLEAVDDPLANQQELSADVLVAVVLSRNRSLAAMQAAWRSTAARYPQAMSLDDPEFMSLMAPGSFNDPNFQSSFMVGASQKLPWPGKRGLRGEAVRADTAAAYLDAGELAVRLESVTRSTFVEYYRARRQLALVDDNLQQLRQLRGLAQSKYEARSATQQDMLQADVDLAELARRRIELAQAEKIAIARINTLAHRAPMRRCRHLRERSRGHFHCPRLRCSGKRLSPSGPTWRQPPRGSVPSKSRCRSLARSTCLISTWGAGTINSGIV